MSLAHKPMSDERIPPPLSIHDANGARFMLGCLICRQRVTVSEAEYYAVLSNDLSGTICPDCENEIDLNDLRNGKAHTF